MKTLQQVLDKIDLGRTPRIVHYTTSNHGYIPLPEPKMADEISCPFCDGKEYYTWMTPDKTKAWICGRVCSPSKLPNFDKATPTPPTPKRAILWHLWCQINDIGDVYHDVKFELIHQSPKNTKFLLDYSLKPHGIILIHGSPGTGKTYACLSICELFTRKNSDALFFTQKTLTDKWLQTFKEERASNFVSRCEEVSLLVIDDFGIAEPTPAFLSFFMNMISARIQWTNRGTVITTNLNKEKLSEFCGEALSDRIKTGFNLLFSGKSRRNEPKTKGLYYD